MPSDILHEHGRPCTRKDPGRRGESTLYGTAAPDRTRLATGNAAGTSQGHIGGALHRTRTAGYSSCGGEMGIGSVLEAATACSTVRRATDLDSGLLRSQSLR